MWEREQIRNAAEGAAHDLAIAEGEAAAAAGNAPAVISWYPENDSSPQADEASQNGEEEEPDYKALRSTFDDEYMRQNEEYKAHILNMCKKGFTRESFPGMTTFHSIVLGIVLAWHEERSRFITRAGVEICSLYCTHSFKFVFEYRLFLSLGALFFFLLLHSCISLRSCFFLRASPY